MPPVRLVAVRYLNTAPLIEGLDKLPRLELLPTVPAKIAPMVTRGEADLGLCSVVDILREEHALAFVPVGQIGCDGPTLTVRLYSRVPFEQVMALAADTDSHTSVLLARLILLRRFGVSPRVADFDARERVVRGGGEGSRATDDDGWPQTLLLIGDKVITDAPPRERYPFQLDLGEAWHAWTGLPFVYAMWACRRDRMDDEGVRLASELLDRQRRHNQQRLAWIIASRAPQARWPLAEATRYIAELLRYDVGERERAGIERFASELHAANLLTPARAPWLSRTSHDAPALATPHP